MKKVKDILYSFILTYIFIGCIFANPIPNPFNVTHFKSNFKSTKYDPSNIYSTINSTHEITKDNLIKPIKKYLINKFSENYEIVTPRKRIRINSLGTKQDVVKYDQYCSSFPDLSSTS